jgi:acetylornithine deacetylase/succinyl-diaminopimelate desuccinylase-like protein
VAECVTGRPDGPRLILNGHTDVFRVGEAGAWSGRHPWSGDKIVNGKGELAIHGRGTVDMKAGTAASVIAYAYLHTRKRAPRQVFGTDGCIGRGDGREMGRPLAEALNIRRSETASGVCKILGIAMYMLSL